MQSGPQMMRRGHFAMKNGSWEDFKERYRKEGTSSEWTFERIREAFEKVAKDEIARLGIVQEILRKRRRIIPSMEWEESFCRMFAHIAPVSPWRTTFGAYRRETGTAAAE